MKNQCNEAMFPVSERLRTLMTGKIAHKSGALTPAGASNRRNYRIPEIFFGSRGNLWHQVADAHQIVSGGRQGELPGHPLGASVPSLPQIADGFYPAEDFFHPIA